MTVFHMYMWWLNAANPFSSNPQFQPAPLFAILLFVLWLLIGHIGGILACMRARVDARDGISNHWQYWAGFAIAFVLAPPFLFLAIGIMASVFHKEEKFHGE